MENLTDLDLHHLPPPCSKCGYLSGILSKVPPPMEAPTSLLRSQYLPSTTDRMTIQSIVSSGNIAIQSLETQLSELKMATRLLQSRLSNIRRHTEFQRSLLSPVHQLPNDLLVEIFFYVFHTGVDMFTRSGDIWNVLQVCARWRNVAQDTPLLWSKITVAQHLEKFQPCTVAARIRSCLEYSREVPLSVTLALADAAISDRTIQHAIKDVVNHAHRWTYLATGGTTLCFILREDTTIATLIQQEGLPNLRTLKLMGCHSYTAYSAFQGATALDDVSLCYGTVPDAFAFPWTNVRRLSVGLCNIGSSSREFDISSLFCAMPHLEDLEWAHNRHRLRAIPSVITLAYLRDLRVVRSPELHKIMPMLRVPCLTTLEVEGRIIDAGPLLSMIQMSTCVIERLSLSFESSTPALQILEKLHGVKILSLSLTTIEASWEVLSSLIWDSMINSKGPFLLPSLRQLEDIMDSRSSSANANAGSRNSLPAPLCLVKCMAYTYEDEYDEYDDMFGDLEEFGEELGIPVDFQLIKTKNPYSDRDED
ncbi:hypothetical protein BDQ17DRAFT_489902 [Cyathus striatus]|nr:hypothetical protein BDQ17DRAFT_489902 [Cyathus striatus]